MRTADAFERGTATNGSGHRLAGALLSITAAVLPAPATHVVSNLNDSGSGSLRQAIAAAAPGDTIVFSVSGTITLTSGALVLDKDLTIDGPGPGAISIRASGSRALIVDPGVTADVLGLTIRDAVVTATGAGVLNNGTLTMTNCVVRDNQSHSLGSSGGGGIFNGGSLTLNHCRIADNLAHVVNLGGGGILNAGILQMTDCAVDGNAAEFESIGGGGILNESFATATLVRCRITGNYNDEGTGTGGGIHSSGMLTIIDSTVAGNSSKDYGGGIHNFGGTLIVVGCTLRLNHAYFWGGGLYNSASGSSTVTNTTFTENLADFTGGAGLSNLSGTVTLSYCLLFQNYFSGIENLGTINVKNTILADSYNCLEPVNVLAGANFATDATCGPGFTIVTPAQLALGPLGFHGGPTPTHPLLPSSIAIDAAPDCTDFFGGAVVIDQRGVPRPQGGTCDVGPFEVASDG